MINHLCTLHNSRLTYSLNILIFSHEEKIFMSSANRMNCNTLELLQMSFIYIQDHFDPRIEPWDTPHSTLLVLELALFISTYCCLSSK